MDYARTSNIWPCAFRPKPPREQPTRITSRAAALIVPATGDIATTYRGARALHRLMTGSRLLTLRARHLRRVRRPATRTPWPSSGSCTVLPRWPSAWRGRWTTSTPPSRSSDRRFWGCGSTRRGWKSGIAGHVVMTVEAAAAALGLCRS